MALASRAPGNPGRPLLVPDFSPLLHGQGGGASGKNGTKRGKSPQGDLVLPTYRLGRTSKSAVSVCELFPACTRLRMRYQPGGIGSGRTSRSGPGLLSPSASTKPPPPTASPRGYHARPAACTVPTRPTHPSIPGTRRCRAGCRSLAGPPGGQTPARASSPRGKIRPPSLSPAPAPCQLHSR